MHGYSRIALIVTIVAALAAPAMAAAATPSPGSSDHVGGLPDTHPARVLSPAAAEIITADPEGEHDVVALGALPHSGCCAPRVHPRFACPASACFALSAAAITGRRNE